MKRALLLTATLALCSLCLLCGCHFQDDSAQDENGINNSVAIDESGRSVSIALIKRANSEQWKWTSAVNPDDALIETNVQQVKPKQKGAAPLQTITLQAVKSGHAVVRFTPRETLINAG